MGRFGERKTRHKSNAFNEKSTAYHCHFYRDIRKYGWDNFKWAIVEIFPPMSNKEEYKTFLDEREAYWIAFYDSYRKGYNITKGGKGVVGHAHSTETKRKISEANKKLAGENNPFYGEKHSDETRDIISKALRAENHPLYGKPRSEEQERKQSEAMKGKIPHNKGKSMSEEQKRKLSKSNGGTNHPQARAVAQLDKIDGKFMAEYPTAKEAVMSLGKKNGSDITQVCKRNKKTAFGFKWMYKDEYEGLLNKFPVTM
nr:NUMOD3 domain-containing DNA-binding protein [Bacillus thuringiensis]